MCLLVECNRLIGGEREREEKKKSTKCGHKTECMYIVFSGRTHNFTAILVFLRNICAMSSLRLQERELTEEKEEEEEHAFI